MEEKECLDSNMDIADGKSLLANMEDQKKQLQLKRRWLMGLPISESEKKSFSTQTCLLESYVREDDLFPGIVRRLIKQIRGAQEEESVSEYYKSPQLANIRRLLETTPDALTIKGLHFVAQSLTGGGGDSGSLSTRKQMKVVIKEALSKVHRRDHSKLEAEFSHVLDDPQNINFQEIYLLRPSSSRIASSVVAILDSLERLPTEALLAMHRALRGKPPSVPRMQHARSGWSREKLIHSIKEMSSELFPSESFDDYDDEALPSPLTKALAIAGLSFKYMVGLGSASHSLTDFVKFPKETLAVQEEIAKAIAMIGSTKVRVPELRSLQLLLDPQADDVPNGSLRTLLKKMLTEHLFECGGGLGVSESLTEALSIINRRSSRGASHGFVSKEEIEEEVERVLDLSACMKQLVWDFLPESDRFEQDYNDAYMEELEESEEEDDDSFEDCNVGCGYEDDQEEEHVADNMVLLETTSTVLNPMAPCLSQELTTHLTCDGTSSESQLDCKGKEVAASDEVASYSVVGNNAYLGIQQACDESSMVAYDLIGRVLEGLAENEGLELDLSDRSYLRGSRPAQEYQGKDEKQASPDGKKNATGTVFLRAIEELLPSLPKSVMDKLKDLISN